MTAAVRRHGALRSVLAVVLGLIWVGLGLAIGWFVGDLADHLVLPAHHVLIYAALGLCAVLLGIWVYATRLLYLEVRAGLDEATSESPTRARTGYAWTAAVAGPVVGLLLALSSTSVAHGGGGGQITPPPAVTVTLGAPRTQNAVSARTTTTTYVVRPGETLTTIAQRAYGHPGDWTRIAAANAGRLEPTTGTRLVDPSLVAPGTRLALPGASAPGPTPADSLGSVSSGATTRAIELYAALGGLGMLGAALFARLLVRRRAYQKMRSPVGGRPPKLAPKDAAIEAALRPLSSVELPDWIDAANRLLCASLVADPSIDPPSVSLVRAGPRGVELLLDKRAAVAPEGFVVADEGHTWRLDAALGLDELRSAAGHAQPYLAVLIPVAEDDSGSYLVACGPGESLGIRASEDETRRALGSIRAHLAAASWAEVECYRVGEASFVGGEQLQEVDLEVVAGLDEVMARAPLWRAGLPEAQPVVIVEDPHLAAETAAAASGIVAVIGTMLEADRICCYEGATLTIEPLGIVLPTLLPSDAELAAIARLGAAAAALPRVPLEDLSALPAPDAELPSAGPVEVRLLLPEPELVGDIDPTRLHPEVVQIIAYLSLHGYTATTDVLRDAFSRYEGDSLSARTIWNAASRARTVLGKDRLPAAFGVRPYLLDRSVSCDWLRLRGIASIGRSLELAGQIPQAIETLRVALELIGDGPPCSASSIASRYSWLDVEQLTIELETVVVRAAHSMALLSIEHRPSEHSLNDAAWAIERGRVISPEAAPLREAALLLAAAREDEAELEAEFYAAVDAVDDLELGEEVDPGVETMFQQLIRRHDGPGRRTRGALRRTGSSG